MSETSDWSIRKKSLINSICNPFKNKRELSTRSQAISSREMDPEVFIKRITPQIKEVQQQGLPYFTPEEWDNSFKKLGGGQSRRKSSTILQRMTWTQFIYYVEEVFKDIK